jgi:septum formation protein
MVAHVDEAAAKQSLAQLKPRDLADALAELKAMKLGLRENGLILGCDSVVALDDGTILDKPASREDAARQLGRMSGSRHELISAAVIVESGRPVWRHVGTARMHVRALSDAFIAAYLDAEWPAVSGSVGCYHVEGRGAQLFARIEGDQFTVMGLPLLPLLDYLRIRGVLMS